MSNDWFKPPKGPTGDPAGRLENTVCRKALTLAGLGAASVVRQAGLGAPHTARLTFQALRAHCEFPADPRVVTTPPDEIGVVLTKFRRSRLYVAWLGLEDDEPDTEPGTRAMIFKGPTWGAAVLYEPRQGSPPIGGDPYITCGFVGRDLVIQPYTGWLRTIGWIQTEHDDNQHDATSEDFSDF